MAKFFIRIITLLYKHPGGEEIRKEKMRGRAHDRCSFFAENDDLIHEKGHIITYSYITQYQNIKNQKMGQEINMNTFLHYKERSPEETVKFLKGLLKKLNVEVEEQWSPNSEVDTASLRVVFQGTDAGTNGKGVSKEYALASAYGELFERYQNLLIEFDYVENGHRNKVGSPLDLKYLSREAVIAQDPELYAPIMEAIEKVFQLSENPCLPFYNTERQIVEYVPEHYLSVFGSNGMSGGNTPEEALVQALAEILERHVLVRIYLEKPVLPTIPDEYIQKFPYVYEMYSKLRENKDFYVVFKDASFGGEYPVAALLIVEKNTGRYGFKLGCHPDFGVAMERTITEAAQNRKIFQYVESSVFTFDNSGIDAWRNISSGFRDGSGHYPYQLLTEGDPSLFVPCKDVTGLSNKELLQDMVAWFKTKKLKLLVRDVSYTGFYSYHVIVPNFSELDKLTSDMMKRGLVQSVARDMMSNVKHLQLPEIKRMLVGILASLENNERGNGGYTLVPAFMRSSMPYHVQNNNSAILYLAAMCYLSLGYYKKAKSYVDLIINLKLFSGKEHAFLVGVKYYCEARMFFKTHEEAIDNCRVLLSEDIITKLDELFSEPEKILYKQYPDSTLFDQEAEKRAFTYDQAIKNVMRNNPIDQMRNQLVFQEII